MCLDLRGVEKVLLKPERRFTYYASIPEFCEGSTFKFPSGATSFNVFSSCEFYVSAPSVCVFKVGFFCLGHTSLITVPSGPLFGMCSKILQKGIGKKDLCWWKGVFGIVGVVVFGCFTNDL